MKKIMIIEDDKDLQEIYKINFEMVGYEVMQEFDGLDGIASVVDKKPDAILLDINMPNMDGFAFLNAINDNTSINIPVIVCSNLSDQETQNKALSSGAAGVLVKVDYSGKQLVEKVGHILNGIAV
ncbi:MAG: response regulator [Candidatus Pacebacteria bacterium]|nr:response regulator [Candidatus Paceibacterota bacterium]MBP9866536.1 response regulator [Candidatus Paceibacterota bacterium]